MERWQINRCRQWTVCFFPPSIDVFSQLQPKKKRVRSYVCVVKESARMTNTLLHLRCCLPLLTQLRQNNEASPPFVAEFDLHDGYCSQKRASSCCQLVSQSAGRSDNGWTVTWLCGDCAVVKPTAGVFNDKR